MVLKNSEIYLFFDDGNVLNDNSIRAKKWKKLVGKYLSSRFGGEPELWGLANAKIIENFQGKDVPKLIYENRDKPYQEFREHFIERWIHEMFDFVEIMRPERKYYKRIYYGAAQFVDLRVNSEFPGVIESIKHLFNKGFNLNTASGTESLELEFYLEGMGIKQFFRKFYGPDLINILKVDKAFYNAIFKDLDIKPEQTIFIEDKPYYLNVASKLGGNVIQACLTGEYEPQFPYFITKMNNLPAIVEEIIKDRLNIVRK